MRDLYDEGNDGEAAALALCWYSAQRPCDVLLLRMDNIKVTMGQLGTSGDKYVIRFREGKVVGRVEAYHIHMTIPDEFSATVVNKWLQKRRQARAATLFRFENGYKRTKFVTTLRSSLRKVHEQLELLTCLS